MPSSGTRSVSRAALCAVAVLAGAGLPGGRAAAQIPDRFENLKVLPADISRERLTGIMRGFSMALGVRCQYCHPGGSGGSLEGVDFRTDEDPDKEKARFMMRMVADLNARLPQLPDRDSPSLDVACVTCHRGLARPFTLAQELEQVIEREGAGAAVTRYAELRQEYFGSGAYDFGAASLNELGRTLAGSGRTAEAITILELNARQHPEDAASHLALGQLYGQAGEREKAIAAFERVLQLEPNNRQARQALQRIRGGG